MLASAVQKFTNDLQIISENIKSRTVGQIKGALQKKAYNDAGIVVQQVSCYLLIVIELIFKNVDLLQIMWNFYR